MNDCIDGVEKSSNGTWQKVKNSLNLGSDLMELLQKAILSRAIEFMHLQ
jgi:hypothetical protein